MGREWAFQAVGLAAKSLSNYLEAVDHLLLPGPTHQTGLRHADLLCWLATGNYSSWFPSKAVEARWQWQCCLPVFVDTAWHRSCLSHLFLLSSPL